ncbi:MAG: DUF58 domain-containing protein [Planctomycetota bacterium]|nr:DUF58 domain-containing protein [Planctomycetota bacterium]
MRFEASFWRELEELRLLARRLYAPSRMKRLKRIGSGLELADRRPYTAGDEIRYLDWKYFARSGKLNLRLFEEERELLYLLLLDSSASMHSKFTSACQIALALCDLALNAGDRIILAFASDGEARVLSELKGAASTRVLVQPLENAKAAGTTSLLRSLGSVLEDLKSIQALIVVSDFFDPQYRAALSFAQSRSLPQILVAVHSQEDRVFTEELSDFRLVDSETGERVELSIDDRVRKTYEEEYRDFCTELCETARETSAEVVITIAEQPFRVPVEKLLSLGYFLP